ncbi:hypothetical protein SAY87_025468 [Trapa incisa]|uniref:Uncharacterized protein n=1 Tax=Trapa incisa TaxID=236973 RepID=A0AAN7JGJ7_9MYRT|nr:hypothetical protein SAY87_025468 [Trapa incisa]
MIPLFYCQNNSGFQDKWRNLVKASKTQLRKKRKVPPIKLQSGIILFPYPNICLLLCQNFATVQGTQGRKQLTHQAPEPVLCRVRELAKLQHLPEKTTVVRGFLSDKRLLLGGKFEV